MLAWKLVIGQNGDALGLKFGEKIRRVTLPVEGKGQARQKRIGLQRLGVWLRGLGQKPWHDIPVFNWHEGRLSALYSRRYIESARRFPEVAPLTPQQIEALDLLDDLAEDPAISLQMAFRPGDMQWVHNHTMLHDRTSFEDWPEPERKRHLLRLWLAVPGARPLPKIYAERFGKVEIGDRGGIIVPGAALNAPLEAV